MDFACVLNLISKIYKRRWRNFKSETHEKCLNLNQRTEHKLVFGNSHFLMPVDTIRNYTRLIACYNKLLKNRGPFRQNVLWKSTFHRRQISLKLNRNKYSKWFRLSKYFPPGPGRSLRIWVDVTTHKELEDFNFYDHQDISLNSKKKMPRWYWMASCGTRFN